MKMIAYCKTSHYNNNIILTNTWFGLLITMELTVQFMSFNKYFAKNDVYSCPIVYKYSPYTQAQHP